MSCLRFSTLIVLMHRISRAEFQNCEIGPDYEIEVTTPTVSRTLTGTSMKCSHILSFPFQLDEDFYGAEKIYEIIVYSSHVINVAKDSFENFRNLLVLKLNAIGIESITRGGFNGIPDLQELHLQGNSLTIIHEEIFNHLIHLETLDLSNNLIQFIEDGALQNLISLNKLNLSKNNINKLSNSTFTSMKSLKHLDLSKNKLKMESALFHNLFNLMLLNLSNNKINILTKGEFKDLKALQFLDLSSNFLDTFPLGSLTGLENLIHFNVSRNKIFNLNCLALYDLKNLRQIYLDHNRLSVLNVTDLLACTSLEVVSLDENDWECRKLLQCLQDLRKAKVNVVYGSAFRIQNIHGIRCRRRLDLAFNIYHEDKKRLKPTITTTEYPNLKFQTNTHHRLAYQQIHGKFKDDKKFMGQTGTTEGLLENIIKAAKSTNQLLNLLLKNYTDGAKGNNNSDNNNNDQITKIKNLNISRPRGVINNLSEVVPLVGRFNKDESFTIEIQSTEFDEGDDFVQEYDNYNNNVNDTLYYSIQDYLSYQESTIKMERKDNNNTNKAADKQFFNRQLHNEKYRMSVVLSISSVILFVIVPLIFLVIRFTKRLRCPSSSG